MTVLIKLGGSAITNKGEKYSFKEDVIRKISNEISKIEEKIILVHGGGSFGHAVALEHGVNENGGLQPQGFSRVHKAMSKLNMEVVSCLHKAEINAIPVQTSACFMRGSNGVKLKNRQIVRKFLDSNFTPVFYGDGVIGEDGELTILSGDQIVGYLARNFPVDRVIMGTDVDGVYTKDPKSNEKTELIPEISSKNWKNISSTIEFSSGEDVTGGMENKVEVLIGLAQEGIESQIINIEGPENLFKAIKSDKRVGTKITEG